MVMGNLQAGQLDDRALGAGSASGAPATLQATPGNVVILLGVATCLAGVFTPLS
jgi:hypothetical protein